MTSEQWLSLAEEIESVTDVEDLSYLFPIYKEILQNLNFIKDNGLNFIDFSLERITQILFYEFPSAAIERATYWPKFETTNKRAYICLMDTYPEGHKQEGYFNSKVHWKVESNAMDEKLVRLAVLCKAKAAELKEKNNEH